MSNVPSSILAVSKSLIAYKKQAVLSPDVCNTLVSRVEGLLQELSYIDESALTLFMRYQEELSAVRTENPPAATEVRKSIDLPFSGKQVEHD